MANLETLQRKFPRLYAEYPRIFETFFDEDGKMTLLGQKKYQELKKKRRARMKK